MGTHPIFESDFDCLTEARMSDKEKFKMTKEEAEKLTKAMEKPEFRDLLFDYVKEIQDPANRAQYESDLKKYEEQLKTKKIETAKRKENEKKNIAPEVKTEVKEAKVKSNISGNRRNLNTVNNDIF